MAPTRQRHRRRAQPDVRRDAQAERLLLGEPRHAAPARRHHPVDQRRHAAPVDHPGRREHRLPEGRQRQQRARHAAIPGPGARDVLLHQPAERAADVLPRPRLGHHPAERVCRRGRRLPDHRPDGAEPDRHRRRPRRPRHRHPADHPGQDLRARARPQMAKLDPTWNADQVGRRGQPLDTTTSTCPRRTPATPRHERVRTLDVRPVVLAAGQGRQVPADRQPVLRPDALRPGRRSRLLRAGADPVDAERLGRHGAFNDTPDRQRHGLPDHDGRPEGVPLPDPQRGQRPLLEPVRGTSPTRPPGRQRGRPEAGRGRGRADRPERLPDARTPRRARRARLDPDRHRGRVPAGPGGRAGPADHLDHRPDPLRRRQRRQALAAAGTGRAGRRRSSTSRSSGARR